MKTALLRWLLPAYLLLAGCLEFDAQEVVLRHDAAQDRIDMLLVYRGLYAERSNQGQDKVKKALDDLDLAKASGQFALWCNWPTAVDPTADHDAPSKALLAHVDVENGPLFTDPTGRLCSYQFVRIRSAKAFVQKLNTLLDAALQAALVTGMSGYGPAHRFDADTRELLREFQRGGEKLLAVDGTRIELRLPCSPPDLAWVLGQIEEHMLRNVAREIVDGEQRLADKVAKDAAAGAIADKQLRKTALGQAPSFRFFWDNPCSIERRAELTTIAFGVAGADELRLQKSSDGAYDDALLQALRERKEPIEDGVPDAEIRRRFAAFAGRDAVLPAKLAALRPAAK